MIIIVIIITNTYEDSARLSTFTPKGVGIAQPFTTVPSSVQQALPSVPHLPFPQSREASPPRQPGSPVAATFGVARCWSQPVVQTAQALQALPAPAAVAEAPIVRMRSCSPPRITASSPTRLPGAPGAAGAAAAHPSTPSQSPLPGARAVRSSLAPSLLTQAHSCHILPFQPIL